MSGWVARFGVPSRIVSDRGPQFEAHVFTAFTALLGTPRSRTAAYHPACNGLVERLHRQLKAAIMAHTDTAHWVDALPVVLLGLRSALKQDLSCSSAELVYGTTLRLPNDFFDKPSQLTPDPVDYLGRLHRIFDNMRPCPPRPASHRPFHVPLDLATCSHVYLRTDAIRKALQPPYTGPHPVLSRSEKFYTISINGRSDTVSIDRLKPAYIASEAADLPIPAADLDAGLHRPAQLHKRVSWCDRLAAPRCL